jgi:hypothetical protein
MIKKGRAAYFWGVGEGGSPVKQTIAQNQKVVNSFSCRFPKTIRKKT